MGQKRLLLGQKPLFPGPNLLVLVPVGVHLPTFRSKSPPPPEEEPREGEEDESVVILDTCMWAFGVKKALLGAFGGRGRRGVKVVFFNP